jgi:hypothetical protein
MNVSCIDAEGPIDSIGKNVVLWTTSLMLVQGPQGPWEPQVRGILDDFYPHHGNTRAVQVSPDCQISRDGSVHQGSPRLCHTGCPVRVARHSHVLIFTQFSIKVQNKLFYELQAMLK